MKLKCKCMTWQNDRSFAKPTFKIPLLRKSNPVVRRILCSFECKILLEKKIDILFKVGDDPRGT